MTRPPMIGDPRHALRDAGLALRAWGPRQCGAATLASLAFGLVIGVATVLIPNPIFGRDIPVVWWNYPVWLVTSALSGLLAATYVRGEAAPPGSPERDAGDPGASADTAPDQDERPGRLGLLGGFLAWFAVGCPVCNKLAVLALGYTGAATTFAGFQPFLAAAAVALTSFALVIRLKGEVACPASRAEAAVAG